MTAAIIALFAISAILKLLTYPAEWVRPKLGDRFDWLAKCLAVIGIGLSIWKIFGNM